MGAVVGVQVHLLDFLHQRVPGVGAGALVVEGLLYHGIQPIQEVLLVNAIVPDGLLDAHPLFQDVNGGNQILQLLFIRATVQFQIVRNFGVSRQGVGMVVLGEGAHLHGNLG